VIDSGVCSFSEEICLCVCRCVDVSVAVCLRPMNIDFPFHPLRWHKYASWAIGKHVVPKSQPRGGGQNRRRRKALAQRDTFFGALPWGCGNIKVLTHFVLILIGL